MQNVNRINVLPIRAKLESRFNFLAGMDEEPFLTRLYKVIRASISQTEPPGHYDSVSRLEIESDAYTDLAFLKQDAAAPFPVRLARELTETIRAIRQDPITLVSLIAKRESSSQKKKRRMNTGITVAILIYSIALSAVYASYAIFHRRDSSAGDEQHLKITHLQLPPMPVTKTLPVLKQPGGNSKSQLAVPAQPPGRIKQSW